jgi:energy-coupling factor transporter ATP-binding protein EcfA2
MTKTVAVIGPLGAGKTFLATSLALYLHWAAPGKTVFIDASPDKTGARLLKGLVPLAAEPAEALQMKARYAVVDTSIYNIPSADKYVAVLEPTDLRRIDVEGLQRRGYYIVVNKAGALSAWARGWIPFVREVAWSYQRGVHPLLCGSPPLARFRRRIGKILKQIAQWL